MNPGSSTESYPAFAHIGLRENPGKNLNQVTFPDRDSNPGHLVSRPDALTVTPQGFYRVVLVFVTDVSTAMLWSSSEQLLDKEIVESKIEKSKENWEDKFKSYTSTLEQTLFPYGDTAQVGVASPSIRHLHSYAAAAIAFESKQNNNMGGVIVGGRRIKCIRFADDMALLAEKEMILKDMLLEL
ncbi:hypothetical protein ANN_19878 [Periplaneta americana]|uniref:Reverse transcriptase domain-containing protein n=1 Tax=Periplaneta americana TaxID=6978 RepID=A0ABQ8SBR6_PERAM|nr:hypothetical protein ANN_19878 [Periplaneta americana]